MATKMLLLLLLLPGFLFYVSFAAWNVARSRQER